MGVVGHVVPERQRKHRNFQSGDRHRQGDLGVEVAGHDVAKSDHEILRHLTDPGDRARRGRDDAVVEISRTESVIGVGGHVAPTGVLVLESGLRQSEVREEPGPVRSLKLPARQGRDVRDSPGQDSVAMDSLDQVVQRTSNQRVGIEQEDDIGSVRMLEPEIYRGAGAPGGEFVGGYPAELDSVGGQPGHPIGQPLVGGIPAHGRNHRRIPIRPSESSERVGQATELIQERGRRGHRHVDFQRRPTTEQARQPEST